MVLDEGAVLDHPLASEGDQLVPFGSYPKHTINQKEHLLFIVCFRS